MTVSIEEHFKSAGELWDLKRLYDDLAVVKGDSLTRTEKLHLRGLLCGYSPAVLAKKLHKSPRGLQSDVSSTINQYIKKLVNKHQCPPLKKLNNAGDIGDLLEKAGYKKVSNISIDGVNLPIECTESVVKINNLNVVKTNNKNVTVEINIRLITSLPVEQLSKLLTNKDSPEDSENE
jgi:hypothetical protein